MHSIYFTKDIGGLLASKFGSDFGREAVVAYHAMYGEPKVKARKVVDALEVITTDPQVKAIFFNIFGGITRCDEVARGILQALSQLDLSYPIVVRLDGTNAEEGRKLLADSGLAIVPAVSMADAAEKVVAAAR